MKVKDLMVGDWVYIHEPECKGHRIDAIDELDGQVGADGEVYDECFIRPIPLTEEILVKNGWFALDEYRYEGDVALAKESSGFRLKNTDICVKSVHQLQHLLRLCGIEKELTI